MGAQVIKIEDLEKTDYLRYFKYRVEEESAFFPAVNRNKQSIKLNLRHPKGKEVFMRLAAQCDIIIENFRPGVVDALGIGYQQVSKVNPGLIYCSTPSEKIRLNPRHAGVNIQTRYLVS